jgi:hypothetical protein
MTPSNQRLLFNFKRTLSYTKAESEAMSDFFFRNLIAGNKKFEMMSVISSKSNVELVTANLDRTTYHQLITRYLCRSTSSESSWNDQDIIYEWKSL